MSIFDNTMKKCKVKINDNIFSEGELFPLKAYHCWNYNLETVPLPTAIHKLLIRSACIPNRWKHENPMDDRDRGQSRSTVGQNLHILYITRHLYNLDGYEKWRGFGLCRWRPLVFSNFLVIDIHYADRVQPFNPRQLRGVVATPHEFSELDATPFGVSRWNFP